MGLDHDTGICAACQALANSRLSGYEVTDPVFIEELHQQAAGKLSVHALIRRAVLHAAELRAARLQELGE